MTGCLNIQRLLQEMAPSRQFQATRQWSGHVFKTLMEHIPKCSSAARASGTPNQMGFQSSRILDRDQPDRRVVRCSISEHAMAAILNGLTAFSPGAFISVTATFLMFYLYAAPGVRMGALSGLKVSTLLHIIPLVEDRMALPTSLLRWTPSERCLIFYTPVLLVRSGHWCFDVRPGCLKPTGHPVFGMRPTSLWMSTTSRNKLALGGYTLLEKANAQVTLVSCGSELQFLFQAALKLNELGILTRVLSMPCISLFKKQSTEYRDAVLSDTPHVISVEAHVWSIWFRFCAASICMDSFGYCGAGAANFQRFGFDGDNIVRKVRDLVTVTGSRRRWVRLK